MPEHWKDDVLDRRAIGDFLYRLCQTQYQHQHYHSTEKGGALCMAIDADWGGGEELLRAALAEGLDGTRASGHRLRRLGERSE